MRVTDPFPSATDRQHPLDMHHPASTGQHEAICEAKLSDLGVILVTEQLATDDVPLVN
jgi:hypothetical protein